MLGQEHHGVTQRPEGAEIPRPLPEGPFGHFDAMGGKLVNPFGRRFPVLQDARGAHSHPPRRFRKPEYSSKYEGEHEADSELRTDFPVCHGFLSG